MTPPVVAERTELIKEYWKNQQPKTKAKDFYKEYCKEEPWALECKLFDLQLMANVINIPPVKVWVRKEYLRDLRDSAGEYVLGYWVSAKSLPGRTFYFETYLPSYGALFDKLPISAFLSWDPDHPNKPQAPTPDLPLEELQFWNCFSYDIIAIEKNLTYSMGWEVRTKTQGTLSGDYLFTIDSLGRDHTGIDLSFAETPDEHKSFNVIELCNGQLAIYPNNRCRVVDISLSPEELEVPDFLVSSRYFNVERPCGKFGRLGESEEYFWETETEKKAGTHVFKHVDLDSIDQEFDRQNKDSRTLKMQEVLSSPITWIIVAAASEIIGMSKYKDNSVLQLILRAALNLKPKSLKK